jgi:AGZA family xanthine/uracil permease-like MFS transporter
MLERTFKLSEHETTPVREILAGVTTFLTMSYILFVQPAVLSKDFAGQPTGLDAGAVLLATCLSSALATFLMAWLARLPVALAPGMGHNFFFVSVVMMLEAENFSVPWQTALGIVFVSGVLFFLLSLVGIRAALLNALSPSLRSSVAVGIGAFIAFIGLRSAGIVGEAPTLVALNARNLLSADSAVFWSGFVVTLVLIVRGVPGNILIGIAVAAALAAVLGRLEYHGLVGFPDIRERAAFAMDFERVFSLTCLPFVIVFLFMDVFDTMGTLVGVTQQAGLMKDGTIPRLQQAMMADSLGTIAGAALGTSTVTSYIESAAGVQQGGRTGLTAVVVAVLFLLALPLSPLIITIGAYPPITAPALVVVGAMMFGNVRHIDWSDDTEAIPAFLIILGIPLFFSIADGMALGFVSWSLLKLVRGRAGEASWVMNALAVALVAYFLVIRVRF